MITRHKTISPKAKEVSFMLSFGSADVKRVLKAIFETHRLICEPDSDWREDLAAYPFSESALRESIAHESSPTSILPEKTRLEVSKWAFSQALALGYVTECVGQPGCFLFTKKAFDLMEKKAD